MHTPFASRSRLVALCIALSIAVAAPMATVAAQDGRLPDAATRGDNFLGGRTELVGSEAPKNAGGDTVPVAMSILTTNTYVGPCAPVPGATSLYVATRYTVIPNGYSRDTLTFADPGCTVTR